MPTLTDNDLKEIKDLLSFQSEQIKEIKVSLNKINDTIVEIKINQARIEERTSGQIQTLDEKVTGVSKRLENQEFTNRGILIALIVALIAGAAKLFGFLPSA